MMGNERKVESTKWLVYSEIYYWLDNVERSFCLHTLLLLRLKQFQMVWFVCANYIDCFIIY